MPVIAPKITIFWMSGNAEKIRVKKEASIRKNSDIDGGINNDWGLPSCSSPQGLL